MRLANESVDKAFHYERTLEHPVFRPEVLLINTLEENAFATYLTDDYVPSIIITSGLIHKVYRFISTHFTAKTITTIWEGDLFLTPRAICDKIFRYCFEFLVFHELYHLWHGHILWKKEYEINNNGELKRRVGNGSKRMILSEITATVDNAGVATRNANYTQQVLEYDADISAANMLIILLACDLGSPNNQRRSFEMDMSLIYAGMLTLFEVLQKSTIEGLHDINYYKYTHPVSYLRFSYCEDVYVGQLLTIIPEEEWDKLNGFEHVLFSELFERLDVSTVFFSNYYYAMYTKKAQQHISLLRQRFLQIYDSLLEYVMSEIVFPEESDNLPTTICFDEYGRSLRGWDTNFLSYTQCKLNNGIVDLTELGRYYMICNIKTTALEENEINEINDELKEKHIKFQLLEPTGLIDLDLSTIAFLPNWESIRSALADLGLMVVTNLLAEEIELALKSLIKKVRNKHVISNSTTKTSFLIRFLYNEYSITIDTAKSEEEIEKEIETITNEIVDDISIRDLPNDMIEKESWNNPDAKP